MKLPIKIKVGSCDYKVIERDIDVEDDYIGRLYQHKLEIYIEKALPRHRKVHTLFHEIMHAICYEQGNMKLSEHKVDAITSGLVALFRDNPELIELLKEGER